MIIISSIFLISCTQDDAGKIISKLEKVLDNYSGYETKAELEINMDEGSSLYILDEFYRDSGEIKLSILEPKENRGIVIEYRDNNIFLNNASISQSISLKNVKGINRGLLFGEIFENIGKAKFEGEEEQKDIAYYIFSYTSKDANRYNKEKKIYMDKRGFKPYKMIILDEEGNSRAVIRYLDFKYIKK